MFVVLPTIVPDDFATVAVSQGFSVLNDNFSGTITLIIAVTIAGGFVGLLFYLISHKKE